ncbi:MAG: 1-deoxy-D-xylulose-5-phosphate reductoisomerase [Bacteroidota bacterium]|nr:1-deoxy-D-xylulose-5-phosphate reductoisomerase [Bacteroidota bacterium]
MEQRKKNIAILGCTGSIGLQTLEIIDQYPDQINVEVLTAHQNKDLLIQQAIKYKPNVVVIGKEEYYAEVNDSLSAYDIKVYAGEASIAQVVEMDSVDIIMNALVGYSGFLPTISAAKKGKVIALANKESLVVGGALINQLLKEYRAHIIPVDSEHSAIFQCLAGEAHNNIEKIYLTASGGPFRGMDLNSLSNVSKEEALQHPNWNMGPKITIDSATLMNKGFEVIEAKWLFGLNGDQIEVIIHPQSIIHSIVQFEDGSMKAQMNLPNMKGPITYALFYPERIKTDLPRLNFLDYPKLTFEIPDLKKFRNLALAYEALASGGNIPCALNAANEIAVDAFLSNHVGFLEMSDIIEKCIHEITFIHQPSLEDLVRTDEEARDRTIKYIRN